MSNSFRIVVLGDGGVGKSCLTISFCRNIFVHDYDPTIENLYHKQVNVNGHPYMIEILDTAGQEEYSVMKDQHIRSGDGFLLVYSIENRASFELIPTLRDSILMIKDAPDDSAIPIMLIGAKADLTDRRVVQTVEGEQLAASFNCPFIETSAKLRFRVDDSFLILTSEIKKKLEEATAAQEARESPRKKKQRHDLKAKCTIL